MEQPTKSSIWKWLDHQAQSIHFRIPQHVTQNPMVNRQQFNASSCNIHLDYSNQRITNNTLKLYPSDMKIRDLSFRFFRPVFLKKSQ